MKTLDEIIDYLKKNDIQYTISHNGETTEFSIQKKMKLALIGDKTTIANGENEIDKINKCVEHFKKRIEAEQKFEQKIINQN